MTVGSKEKAHLLLFFSLSLSVVLAAVPTDLDNSSCLVRILILIWQA